jgi:hypothetical protein
MSPSLQYLLSTVRTGAAFESERDRADARHAASRMLTHGVRP